jgi:hypothetical protein
MERPPDSDQGVDGERRAPEVGARYEITMMVVWVEVEQSHRMSQQGYHHRLPRLNGDSLRPF